MTLTRDAAQKNTERKYAPRQPEAIPSARAPAPATRGAQTGAAALNAPLARMTIGSPPTSGPSATGSRTTDGGIRQYAERDQKNNIETKWDISQQVVDGRPYTRKRLHGKGRDGDNDGTRAPRVQGVPVKSFITSAARLTETV